MDPIPEIPIDPAILSRDPAVGEAYAADELVYHGPFQRTTLEQICSPRSAASHRTATSATSPTLWIHGSDGTSSSRSTSTRPAIEHTRGSNLQDAVYEGGRHELFNETNRDEVLDDVVAFLRGALD